MALSSHVESGLSRCIVSLRLQDFPETQISAAKAVRGPEPHSPSRDMSIPPIAFWVVKLNYVQKSPIGLGVWRYRGGSSRRAPLRVALHRQRSGIRRSRKGL